MLVVAWVVGLRAEEGWGSAYAGGSLGLRAGLLLREGGRGGRVHLAQGFY